MKLFYTFIFSVLLLLGNAQVSFESFGLEVESFENDSDIGFTEGDITLPNSFNSTYNSFTGFALSTMTDTVSEGFLNQYSVISGSGANNSLTYAVGYLVADNSIFINDEADLQDFQINNTTYTALSMQNGDGFAKKFGGETGDDPDFLLLTMLFYNDNIPTGDTSIFFLADYRFEDNELDYIVKDWTTIDLSEINNSFDEIKLFLSSTDNGAFGMNTPAYIAIDELNFSTTNTSDYETLSVDIYPNPVEENLFIKNENASEYILFNAMGQAVFSGKEIGDFSIDFNQFHPGTYFLRIKSEKQIISKKIIKK